MWILLVLLVQTPILARSDSVRFGSEVTRVLAVDVRDGRNQAIDRVQVELKAGGPCTLTARSLDFQPRLVLYALPGRTVVGEGSIRLCCDSCLTPTIESSGLYEIGIEALDARGGEYSLSTRAGVEPAPSQDEELPQLHEAFVAIAQRAEARHEDTRAIEYWLVAAEVAHSIAHGPADCARAREDLGHCVDLAKRLRYDEDLLEARLLLALCDQLSHESQKARAELLELEPRIEALAQRAGDDRHAQKCRWQRAALHDGLGDALRDLHSLGAAAPEYAKAAEALEGLGLAEQSMRAWSKLALALDECGEAAEADLALDRCDASLPVDSPPELRAEVRMSRARIEVRRGASEAGRLRALEALGLGPPPNIRAETLGTLANACLDLARYEEAALWLDDLGKLIAEAHFEVLEPALHRTRGVLAYRLRDLAQARSELQQALESADALGVAQGSAADCIDLALVLEEQGERSAAEARLDEAITRAESSGDGELLGRAWLDRGLLFERRGELERAHEAYTRTSTLACVASDPLLAALAKGGLGMIAELRHDSAKARQFAGASASELEALGLPEEALDAHDTLAQVALREADAAALRTELDRARELLGRFEREGLGPLQRAWYRARFANWGAFEQALVDIELAQCTGPDVTRQAIVQRGLEADAGWKGRTLLESLARRFPDPAVAQGASAAELQAWLPPHAALLEYFETTDRLGAYLVQKGSLERIDLCDLHELVENAGRFTKQIADSRAPPQQLVDSAAALWRDLLAPLLDRLQRGVDTLVIVPAPVLAAVPFEALVSEPRPGHSPIANEPRCVIDDFLVCYAPASALLPALAARPARRAPERHLIVGDARYSGETRAGNGATGSRVLDPSLADMPRLTYSRAEVVGLARQLLRSQPGEEHERAPDLAELERDADGDHELSARCFDLYLRGAATAGIFRRDLREYSDLHLALHAHMDPVDPRRTGLVFSFSPQDNGLFALEEAWNAKLDANLIVLSACETARGRVLAGEGVQSLAYAFLNAGARAVLATLWRISDRDAGEILQDFEARRQGALAVHPAEALRAARQAFRQRNAVRGEPVHSSSVLWQPSMWAGYVYIGEPPR